MTRRTKIVCTLGPASNTPERIASLIAAGMNVARVNFSHGTLEQHAETIRIVREQAERAETPIAILGDLQGPKIRVGRLAEGVELVTGDPVTFAPEGEERPGELPTTYRELAGDVKPGTRILLNDGLLSCEVTRVEGERVYAKVVYGGELQSNKGINLPGVEVSAPALTDRDREEALRAVGLGVDYIGLSFVHRLS